MLIFFIENQSFSEVVFVCIVGCAPDRKVKQKYKVKSIKFAEKTPEIETKIGLIIIFKWYLRILPGGHYYIK